MADGFTPRPKVPFLCRLGWHKWVNLTPERGIEVKEGLDDEFDMSLYVHGERCDRCKDIRAYVSDAYFEGTKAYYHREATTAEKMKLIVNSTVEVRG